MKRVLIVDDAAFMRLTIKTMLEKHDYEVVGEAENGRIAISRYHELKPDFVTMDITMPEVDGLGALKAIKKLDPGAKILMISALGQEAHVREAIIQGARGFLVKPFNEENFLKALLKL